MFLKLNLTFIKICNFLIVVNSALEHILCELTPYKINSILIPAVIMVQREDRAHIFKFNNAYFFLFDYLALSKPASFGQIFALVVNFRSICAEDI